MNIVSLFNSVSSDHRRQLAQAINELISGGSNAKGSVTLTANQATTTVTDEKASDDSHITLTPITANAVADTVYISTRSNGSFVLTHNNNAQTDRTFTYGIRR